VFAHDAAPSDVASVAPMISKNAVAYARALERIV
jgi:hypothetical protein